MTTTTTATREPKVQEVDRLKALVQEFARSFGLLVAKQTPCGFPLSPSHAHCLMVLLERERAGTSTSQSELGLRLTIDKSNIARLCGKLQSSGHAVQTRAPADGRGRVLQLTTKGRQLAGKLEVASQARFARVLGAVPAGQRAALLESLDAMVKAMRVLHGGVDR